jgi:hypothetical protein
MKLACESRARLPDKTLVVESSTPAKVPVFLAGSLSRHSAAALSPKKRGRLAAEQQE